MENTIPTATRRACLRCGREYFDDGNTWCPGCDATHTPGPGARPDAGRRIAEMRKWTQDNLAAGRPESDPTGKPAWL